MRKLTHEEIVKRQSTQREKPRLPFSVILNNIRSLYNVGSIFRTCDGVGVEKIWLCGITGCPPNKQISKTAIGAEKEVEWEHRKDACSVIKELKGSGYQIVLLEQAEGSYDYSDFNPRLPVCLVIGNEIEGVSQSVVESCDACVEIEMLGVKNSLNVAVAFGVIAYHFQQCLKAKI